VEFANRAIATGYADAIRTIRITRRAILTAWFTKTIAATYIA